MRQFTFSQLNGAILAEVVGPVTDECPTYHLQGPNLRPYSGKVCGPVAVVNAVQQLMTGRAKSIGFIVANHPEVSDGKVHEVDRKSTRLNSSHVSESRMPSSA